MTPDKIDAVAREVITRWLAGFPDLIGPAARATALLTIARVAAEIAEQEQAKIPDWWVQSFVCPRCGFRSYNPNDKANRYCVRCHEFFA